MGRDANQDIVQSPRIVEDTDWQEYVQELGKGWQGSPSRRICPGHSRSRTFPSWLSGPRIDTGSWRRIGLEKKTAVSGCYPSTNSQSTPPALWG